MRQLEAHEIQQVLVKKSRNPVVAALQELESGSGLFVAYEDWKPITQPGTYLRQYIRSGRHNSLTGKKFTQLKVDGGWFVVRIDGLKLEANKANE